ncbi:MAG TPA: tetratricopeptide repeat protein, partial [Chloroflexota bacterium]|nr:tetratricopeptide repeat protein [Chloroflexota bacterium]
MAVDEAALAMPHSTSRLGEFERLHRFVRAHRGRFTLGLVRVNDPKQRDGLLASLRDVLAADGLKLVMVDLSNRHPENLRHALQQDDEARTALQQPGQAVLGVVGLEHLIEAEAGRTERPPFAAALNAERDALRKELPLPLLLFLTDHAMDRLDLASPDFFDWYSGVFRFRPAQAASGGFTIPLAIPMQSQAAIGDDDDPDLPPTQAARLDLLEDRLQALQHEGEGARLAQVLQEIGEIRARTAEYKNRQLAVPYLKRAAEIFHEQEDKSAEANTLETLGDVCYWIDDYAQASRRLEAALPIYREIGARLGEANCIQRLGDVHVRLSELPQARARYEAALPIYREIGDRLGEANCIQRLGDVHVRL